MNENTKKCPRCAATLAPDAPEGLCPRCLLELNLGAATEEFGPDGTRITSPRLEPPPLSEIAGLFPQFEILEFLGRGGMGLVYKARQPSLHRVIALKILAASVAGDARFGERFQREARALAQLNHPNIVTVYDFGISNGVYYLAMEWVDGANLREFMKGQKLSSAQALAIVPRVCEALQYAHNQGVVHRDIKPENILIDKNGGVKIADFGIAKIISPQAQPALTGEQQAIGTPHYMAPEQVERPASVDHRADIYSLGVVFYEMLTGELPLGKFPVPSTKVQMDVRIDEVVLRSLEKDPTRRYQQAGDVKTRVEEIAHTSPSPSPPPLPPTTAEGRWMKSFLAIALGSFVVLLFVAGAGLLAAIAIPNFVHGRQMGRQFAAQRFARDGWLFFQSGEFYRAQTNFSHALELNPASADAWTGLGWALFDSGHAAGAETDFQKALSLDTNVLGAINGLGQLYLAQRKYEKAERYLLKAAPHSSAAAFGLARLYLLQNKFDQAATWAKTVIDSGEGDDTARQMLKAAQEKHIDEALRRIIEPPPGHR